MVSPIQETITIVPPFVAHFNIGRYIGFKGLKGRVFARDAPLVVNSWYPEITMSVTSITMDTFDIHIPGEGYGLLGSEA